MPYCCGECALKTSVRRRWKAIYLVVKPLKRATCSSSSVCPVLSTSAAIAFASHRRSRRVDITPYMHARCERCSASATVSHRGPIEASRRAELCANGPEAKRVIRRRANSELHTAEYHYIANVCAKSVNFHTLLMFLLDAAHREHKCRSCIDRLNRPRHRPLSIELAVEADLNCAPKSFSSLIIPPLSVSHSCQPSATSSHASTPCQ